MKQHLLVVLPHPDDETFGCGGTLAVYAKSGTPITYLCGTLGEMGRNMGNPTFATRETLPIIRKQELIDACRILGVTDLRMMGLRDKTVEFEDFDELSLRILNVIQEIKPTLIITFHPTHGVHPDHNAMGTATVMAVEKLAKEDRPPVHTLAFSKNCVEELGYPDVKVDVSSVAQTKLDAMYAHRSQSEIMLNQRLSDPAQRKHHEQRLKVEEYWTYHFAD